MTALPPLSLWRSFPKPRRCVKEIADAIAQAHGLSLDDITGPRGDKYVIRARFAAYAACRDAGFSYPQIGRRLNRDHTSVMNGDRRYREMRGAVV